MLLAPFKSYFFMNVALLISFTISSLAIAFSNCIYNHRTTKTNQKYPSVNL